MFHLNHEEALSLIKKAGDKLALVVERGDKIVPSLNSAFPKNKEEVAEKPKSYSQEVNKYNYKYDTHIQKKDTNTNNTVEN